MKKIFTLIMVLTLILAVFTVPALAADESPEILSTEGEGSAGVELDGEQTENPESAEKFYSAWLDKLTDSTMWVNLATTLAGLVGVIVFVKSKFDGIRGNLGQVLKGQMSAAEVKTIIKDCVGGAIEAYRVEADAMHAAQMKRAEEERTTIISVLAIFITNAKINAHAKSEIMKLLTSAEGAVGTVEEIVKAATEAIEEATLAEEKVETPALDELAAAPAEDYVVRLG